MDRGRGHAGALRVTAARTPWCTPRRPPASSGRRRVSVSVTAAAARTSLTFVTEDFYQQNPKIDVMFYTFRSRFLLLRAWVM